MSNGDQIDRAEASHTFEVRTKAVDLSCTIVMALDDDRNGDRDCFLPGEEFFVRVWSPVVYAMYTTGGGIGGSPEHTGVLEQIPDPDDPETDEWEYINFSNWQGSASRPIYSILNKHWCGTENLGKVNWRRYYSDLWVNPPAGTTKKGYGILRIKYRTSYDIWKVKAAADPHDMKIVAYSTDPDEPDCKAELQVTIRDNCEGARPKDVTLRATDCETGAPIPEADVYVNGVYKGRTGAEGTIHIGFLRPGTYEVRWEHSDYWPSIADGVVNDSFVVD